MGGRNMSVFNTQLNYIYTLTRICWYYLKEIYTSDYCTEHEHNKLIF